MAGEGKVDFDGWSLRVRGAFLNAAVTGLSDRQLRIVMTLDAHARGKGYCWVGNRRLAGLVGKSVRQTQEILAELEQGDEPWIARIPDTEGNGRTGFVLYRRCDPDAPSWDRARPLTEAAALINDQRHARRGGRRASKGGTVPLTEAVEIAPVSVPKSGRAGGRNPHGGSEETLAPGLRKSARVRDEEIRTQKSTKAS